MRIAVLSTGVVGRTLAVKLDGLGHEVVIGTRDPAATNARTEPGGYGTRHSRSGRPGTRRCG
jgi:predicted dinucleotide-binding enzyme